MIIRYHSWAHRPPHRVSCRLEGDGPEQQYEGAYRDSAWLFSVPSSGWDRFTLTLDAQVSIHGGERLGPTDDIDVEEAEHPRRAPIGVDDGRLQQMWFAEGTDTDIWDVVVVGTGMGGGTLVAALGQPALRPGARDLRVLQLEAGSYLFPIHAAELPRELSGPAAFATSIWNSLPRFGSRPYDPVPGDWGGWEVFAFGGRSLYWGGLAPQLSPAELALWPRPVVDDLVGSAAGPSYYARAEELLGVHRNHPNNLERATIDLLNQLLPDRGNDTAPVAVPAHRRSDRRLADGLFSTAELLLGQRLGNAHPDGSFGPPYIHLGELVTSVAQEDGVWKVRGVDLRDGSPTERQGRRVVLCAGTVETPRILSASGIADQTAGRGFTEHPLAYLHFQLPPGSPLYYPGMSASLLSLPSDDSPDWNLQMQIGTDAILDHPAPAGFPSTRTNVDPGCISGQLVFLGRAGLGPGQLHFDPGKPWLDLGDPPLPSVALDISPVELDHLADWQKVALQIMETLGAQELPGEGTRHQSEPHGYFEVRLSQPGAVSHEVGTMSIGSGVDDDLAVLDPDAEGLYVCDNSVFPSSPSANPSLTLAALALRLADHLRTT